MKNLELRTPEEVGNSSLGCFVNESVSIDFRTVVNDVSGCSFYNLCRIFRTRHFLGKSDGVLPTINPTPFPRATHDYLIGRNWCGFWFDFPGILRI